MRMPGGERSRQRRGKKHVSFSVLSVDSSEESDDASENQAGRRGRDGAAEGRGLKGDKDTEARSRARGGAMTLGGRGLAALRVREGRSPVKRKKRQSGGEPEVQAHEGASRSRLAGEPQSGGGARGRPPPVHAGGAGVRWMRRSSWGARACGTRRSRIAAADRCRMAVRVRSRSVWCAWGSLRTPIPFALAARSSTRSAVDRSLRSRRR